MTTYKEESIEKQLEGKIKKLESELRKYTQALNIIKEVSSPKPTSKALFLAQDTSDQLDLIDDGKLKRRIFLYEKVESILKKENRLLSSRDIMIRVNEDYSQEVKYDFTINWSGTFSQAYRKPKSKIKQYKIKDVPPESSAYYGLKEWFVNDELKKEYREKITDYYKV